MTQLEEVFHWPYELDVVIEMALHQPSFFQPGLPTSTKARLLKDDWVGARRFVDMEVESNAPLPSLITAFFGPRKPGWIQKGIYDQSRQIYEARVIPNHLSSSLHITSHSAFNRAERGTLQTLVCETQCRLAAVGQLVEQQAGQFYLDTFRSYYQQLGARPMGILLH